jgi:6-phosphogluconate dehydrogenase
LTPRFLPYRIKPISYQIFPLHDQLTDFSARLAGINVGAPARPEPSGDFGLIGLAVMGQNLILNAADHGFTVVAYNRTVSKVDRFLANEAKGT